MAELIDRAVELAGTAYGHAHGLLAFAWERLPASQRAQLERLGSHALVRNPLNLFLLAVLLYILVPLLVPASIYEPTTSKTFLREYPTLARARLHGVPGTNSAAQPQTRARWRNYLRRLQASAKSRSSSTNSEGGDSAADPHAHFLPLETARQRAGLSASAARAPAATYSFLPAYHPPSTKWTLYTPRTLALHDGSGIGPLSEAQVRATLDARRDGAATSAAEARERRLQAAQREKGAAAGAEGSAAAKASATPSRAGKEEEEEDIGGYAYVDPNAPVGSSASDPSKRILLAIDRAVYDVTAGASFYGPGGPYSIFAGRDASVGMAKQSFDADVLTPLDQPIARLDEGEGRLTQMERRNMEEWAGHFAAKYGIVGRLVDEHELEAEMEAQRQRQ